MFKLYKSCSVFHMESNEIKFTFFWFFYNFLQILQGSTKLQTLFKNQVSKRSLELFCPLQIYPRLAFKPLERLKSPQCGPRGQPTARLAGFWRGWRRSQPGEWENATRCSPRARWWPKMGQRRLRWACTTTQGGGGCYEQCSNEVKKDVGQLATAWAFMGSKGGVRAVGRHWQWAEGEAWLGSGNGAGGGARGKARRGRARGRGRWPFIGNAHCVLKPQLDEGAAGAGRARRGSRRTMPRTQGREIPQPVGSVGVRSRGAAWSGPGHRCTARCHAARCGAGVRRRDMTSLSLISFNRLWPTISRDFATEALQGVNSKVVEQWSLYNSYKGCPMFCSMVWA
jgi:hypothetical protein